MYFHKIHAKFSMVFIPEYYRCLDCFYNCSSLFRSLWSREYSIFIGGIALARSSIWCLAEETYVGASVLVAAKNGGMSGSRSARYRILDHSVCCWNSCSFQKRCFKEICHFYHDLCEFENKAYFRLDSITSGHFRSHFCHEIYCVKYHLSQFSRCLRVPVVLSMSLLRWLEFKMMESIVLMGSIQLDILWWFYILSQFCVR